MEQALELVRSWSPLLSLIIAVLGVGSMYLTLINRVNAVVEQKLNDENFMNKIVSRLRPYVIFDQNERIIADGGAMQFIDNIKVSGETVTNHHGQILQPKEILIIGKQFLDPMPILESIDENYNIISERGRRYEIGYKLRGTGFIALEPPRYWFRLDIIRPLS